MLAFLGVCWWAFSKHKKKDFDEASQLPFVGDEPAKTNGDDPSETEEKRQN
jgi:cytochrome c oxidase cbb3-type subunit 4